MKQLIPLLILILVLPITGVHAHGSSHEPEQDGLTLPQILAITIICAVIILAGLYMIGITDKKFLLQNLVLAGVLLILDFMMARIYL